MVTFVFDLKMKHKSRARKGKRRSKSASINPPEGAISYRGPARIPDTIGVSRIVTRLSYVTSANANMAGTLGIGLGSNPNAAGEWGNYILLYAEFRVLAITWHLEPYQLNWITPTGTAISQPVVAAIQRTSGASPPVSYSTAWATGSAIHFNSTQRRTLTWRMASTDEAVWQQCSAPVGFATCTVTGTGFAASQPVFQVLVEWLVQLRNRDL